MSQESRILRYLERGRSLTPLEALHRFNCWRLSGRIYDLRREGHNIASFAIKTPSGKRIACYRIVKP